MARTRRARYLEVADDLMSQMTDGKLKVGDALPSTSALTQEYRASATVVRSAIRELGAAGLIEGQPGKAVYVTHLPEKPTGHTPEYLEILDTLSKLTGVVEELTGRVEQLEAKDRA